MSDLAPILQGFFTVKLIQQKDVSPHTIASYRDTWRLLLTYAWQVTRTEPARMRIGQLNHDLIAGFLHHLETERGNSARTRNIRLAAIHSTFRYAQLHAPDDMDTIARVLAIEGARTETREIPWLTDAEADGVLAACDRTTWTGRRDHTMITVLLATGLRISELLNLTRADARIQAAGSHVHCTGKGRKDRSTPLDPAATAALREWLERTSGAPGDPLFTPRGHPPRHAAASCTSRHQRHRAVARPRGHLLIKQIPARGHGSQRTHPRTHHARRGDRSVSADRRHAGLPRQPHRAIANYPEPTAKAAHRTTTSRSPIGMTRISAQAGLWRSRHNTAERTVVRVSPAGPGVAAPAGDARHAAAQVHFDG